MHSINTAGVSEHASAYSMDMPAYSREELDAMNLLKNRLEKNPVTFSHFRSLAVKKPQEAMTSLVETIVTSFPQLVDAVERDGNEVLRRILLTEC